MEVNNIDFFFDLFEKNKIPKSYKSITYSHNNVPLFQAATNEKVVNKKGIVYSVKSVPNYLRTELDKNQELKEIEITQYHKGYSILLTDVSDVDTYLKSQFKSNAVKIRRYKNRLEQSFNIRYQTYFGEISEMEYTSVFESLKKMTERRFTQINEIHESADKFDFIEKNTFGLVRDKKASIFVIYNENIPIEVCINFHFDKMLFCSIYSFDIDYLKFGLGHVGIYKQLEWCLENKYEIFEMGRGDWDYKRRWSNNIYTLQHQLLFSSGNIFSYLIARIIEFKIRLLEYLRRKEVNILYKKIKKIFLQRKSHMSEILPWKIESVKNFDPLMDKTEIDFNKDTYDFILKYIYDFLYSNQEHIDNIKVYKSQEKKHEFFIKGKKIVQKIFLD